MSELNIVDLAALELPSKVVPLNDNQHVRVNGVPYDQLMRLFQDNLECLDKALRGDPSAVTDLIENQPKKVGRLIAFATGNESDEAIAIACKLGAYHQAVIVKAMFELTFPDEEALGKFMAEVETLLKTIVAASVQQKVALITGGMLSKQ